MTNSRNKGAAFEREIANSLNEELNLTIPLKRILEQTREKFLPDLVFKKCQNVDLYINFVQDLGSITKYQA